MLIDRLAPSLAGDRILARAIEIVGEYETSVTLRQLHYRLVSEPELGYLNTEYCYKQLSKLTTEGRRNGSFPPLADFTRSIGKALASGARLTRFGRPRRCTAANVPKARRLCR